MGHWLDQNWKILEANRKVGTSFQTLSPKVCYAVPFVIRWLRQENLGWHRLLQWYTRVYFWQLVSWNLYQCSLCPGYEVWDFAAGTGKKISSGSLHMFLDCWIRFKCLTVNDYDVQARSDHVVHPIILSSFHNQTQQPVCLCVLLYSQKIW